MASLFRPTKANYIVSENVTIDTSDREDHTFCGVMFPVRCKSILPVDQLVIKSISVRGRLGPVTVWVTNQEDDGTLTNTSTGSSAAVSNPYSTLTKGAAKRAKHQHHAYNLRPTKQQPTAQCQDDGTAKIPMKQKYWTKIYDATHEISFAHYTELNFGTNPIILKPGQFRGVYVHSTLDNDEGIVYDNQKSNKTHDDSYLTIFPGRSHVSPEPFGARPIWGYGAAWRDNREFVGRVNYGVVYKLWNPHEYKSFGSKFQGLARLLFACQRRWSSPFSALPDECIFYILNMCRWDWVADSFDDMFTEKKHVRKLLKEREATEAAAVVVAQAEASTTDIIDSNEDTKMPSAMPSTTITSNDDDDVKPSSSTKTHQENNDNEYEEDMDSSYAEDADSSDESDDSDMEAYNFDHRHSSCFTFRNVDECDEDTDDDGDNEDEDALAYHRHMARQRMYRRSVFQLHALRSLVLRAHNNGEYVGDDDGNDDGDEV